MITGLISINTNLGSSIALRYANELSNKIDMRLYDIHVVDAKKSGSSPGFGWVQKTWENALIESKSEEIRQFLDMEKVELPFLKTPKILIGDRTEKLLDELQTGQYAFFLEGALPSFNPNDFYRLVHSRLYRLMPCPVMIVKNLVPADNAALLLDQDSDHRDFIAQFVKIFNNARVKVDLIDLKFSKAKDLVIGETESRDLHMKNADDALKQSNVTSGAQKTIEGAPDKIAECLREYGLIISFLKHKSKKNNPMIELLGRVPSPVLIFWR